MRGFPPIVLIVFTLTQICFSKNEQAIMADGPLGSFYQSFGINLKIDGNAENFVLNKNKLIELGIRNIRTSTSVQGVRPIDSIVCERIRELGRVGINSTIQWREFQSWDKVIETTKSLLPYVVAVEGPNESDIASEKFSYQNQTFPVGTRSFQQDLYSNMKSDSQTKNVDVVLTSVSWGMKYQDPYTTGGISYAGLGNMEAYGNHFNMDYGNMHAYTANSDAPGSAMDSWHLYYARKAAPTLPLMATEGGYNTATLGGGISEWAHARYAPRWFLEQFYHNVARNFLYKLIDDGIDEANPEAKYGLVNFEGTPKPAFDCIKHLLDITRDTGVAYTPESLDYSISGTLPSTVHHMLLQKRDHTFYFVFWNDVKNSNGGTDNIVHTDVAATLNFKTPITLTKTFLPLISSEAQSTLNSPTSIAISIPDQVLVVELVPTSKGNFRPAVSITSPNHAIAVSAGSSQTITATATDCDGTIQRVEFYAETTRVGADSTFPYDFSWNNIPAGDHEIRAVAFDNLGQTDTSASVSLHASPTDLQHSKKITLGSVPRISFMNQNTLQIIPDPAMTFPIRFGIYALNGRLLKSWTFKNEMKGGMILYYPGLTRRLNFDLQLRSFVQ